MRYLLRIAVWSSFALIVLTVCFTTVKTASAQNGDCLGAGITVEGADPSPFVLPRDQGQTIEVDPQSVLLISLAGGNISELQDPNITVSVVASGIEFWSITQALGTGPDPAPIPVNLKEQLPPGLHGLYEIEGTLRDGGEDICTVDFLLKLGEFCATTSAVTAVASVSSVAALASAVPAMRLMILPSLQRRRTSGWRRYIPVPDLKWTIINSVLGAIAGLVSTTLLLQQTGLQPLSIVNALLGMFAGGGLTFGVAYMGALVNYFMSAEPRVQG